jgi:hypothetical protein
LIARLCDAVETPSGAEVLCMNAFPDPRDGDPAKDLERMNTLLSEWAARSATDSAALIDRFEELGYPVRGKSEDEIAEILRQPPTRPRRT